MTVKEPCSLTVEGILALHRGRQCLPWSARERGVTPRFREIFRRACRRKIDWIEFAASEPRTLRGFLKAETVRRLPHSFFLRRNHLISPRSTLFSPLHLPKTCNIIIIWLNI